MGGRVKIQQRQQFMHALVDPLAGPFQKLGHHGDVAGHRPVRKQARALDDIPHIQPQLLRVHGGNVLAIYQDLALAVGQQLVDHSQSGGLAAA
ncbi:hypothetical protein SAMN04487869_10711 [Marinobacter sp. DSM 26671]|nr:hypothetical protein SAMN04487869_10711 [Marinobacter sp. DSM 26671]